MNAKIILMADNDRDYLEARSEFLEMEGYQVIKAYSPEEAEQVLETENIHLAILDIRLADDNDEGDISGILLAKDERYKRVPKIFVTGFPTFEAVREAYGSVIGSESIAHAFLAKNEGPKALIEAVNWAFENIVGINWELRVIWDEMGLLSFPYLVLLLEGGIDPSLTRPRSRELSDLFSRLFSTDEQISFVRLNWFRDGCACLTLFALEEGFSRQAIVILGVRESVNEQLIQAERFLARSSDLIPKPAYAETLHYAGLDYAYPDHGNGPLRSGSSFFLETSDKYVRAALEYLYKRTLYKWHQFELSEVKNADLAALYRHRTGILINSGAVEDARHKIQSLAVIAQNYALLKGISIEGDDLKLVFNNGVRYQGPDPIAVLSGKHAFAKQPAVITSTFGGITLDSLLIDPEGRVYPTDFSSLTQSPLLEDFITIEVGFHFDRIGSCKLFTLWNFEVQLCESQALNDLLPAGSVELECRKTWTIIQTIRPLAAELTSESLEAYLIGLFHYILKDLLRFDPQVYPAKHQAARLVHRLLAASLIITQINRLNGNQDSSNTNPGKDEGVLVNEASREVYVDGREVNLTPTQFKLLGYLHKKANQLCSREEILANVFEIKGPLTKSDLGLLNTHIDRLRKKIDRNPGKHRYIVTIRGEGYLLDTKS